MIICQAFFLPTLYADYLGFFTTVPALTFLPTERTLETGASHLIGTCLFYIPYSMHEKK